MSHLGVQYRLQLNCYRYILEKYYGVRVESMYVVCTHPDNGAHAFVDRVPNMDAEIFVMMEHQRRRDLINESLNGSGW